MCPTALRIAETHLELLDTVGAQAIIHITQQPVHQVAGISRQRDLCQYTRIDNNTAGHCITFCMIQQSAVDSLEVMMAQTSREQVVDILWLVLAAVAAEAMHLMIIH